MAGTLVLTDLQDGPRNYVVHAQIGGDADLSNQVLVDASALDGVPSTVKVVKVQWSFSGLSAVLEWDATADVPFLTLHDGEGKMCLEDVGGLENTAGAGITGDVLITTTGLASGDSGTIVLYCKKVM